MLIPEELVLAVTQASNIVDVIGDFVDLERHGSHWRGLCPFHEESTPSFVVDPHHQMYMCFGCYARGNVFLFLMRFCDGTFDEAVQHLAMRAGIIWSEHAE